MPLNPPTDFLAQNRAGGPSKSIRPPADVALRKWLAQQFLKGEVNTRCDTVIVCCCKVLNTRS